MDGYSRERAMAAHQGETAYHQGSPTQVQAQAPTGSSAPQPPQTHQSPNGPLPHAQQHPHPHPHPHPHHPPNPNPNPNPNPHATELPPISTALYSRDRNTYYDPTQDNGPASATVGRDAAPHPSRYPPQVRTAAHNTYRVLCTCPHPSRPVTAPSPSPSPSAVVCTALRHAAITS